MNVLVRKPLVHRTCTFCQSPINTERICLQRLEKGNFEQYFSALMCENCLNKLLNFIKTL